MARRPDGLGPESSDPGFKEEPNQPPASSRPATAASAINGALPKGSKFPSGLKALEGKADTDRVTLVNLTLKKVTFMRTSGPQAEGKRGVVNQSLREFETFETSVAEARVLLTHQEASAKRRPSPVLVVVGAFPGNCGGKFVFEAHGRTFRTCPFHKCEHGDHGEQPWSVWQSQHFLRTLNSVEAIDRFTTNIELRADVVQLASFERRAREAARRAEQANTVGDVAPSEAVY
jgi:hypothetical protein